LTHLLEALAGAIQSFISSGGYFGILILMALESACIPLPSEVIMPFAGALTLTTLAQQHHREPFNLHMVAFAGALGCALGSALAYWVGAKGGREFVFKYGKFILLKRRDIAHAEAWFARRGQITTFLARLLPVVRTFISLPAGIARMPFGRFLLLSFVGSLPWCYLLAYVGIQFAAHLDDLKKYFHGADAVIGVVILAGLGYWIWHHFQPEKPEEPAPIPQTETTP